MFLFGLIYVLPVCKDSKICDFMYICQRIRKSAEVKHYNNDAMKYFVRSVKYFIYFSLLCSFIVYALVLTGMASGDINEIFEGGYNAIWKIAVFFALVAAVYPKFGFITRKIDTDRSWDEVKSTAAEYLKAARYVVENESDDTITFRFSSMTGRLTKMFEDRITISRTGAGITMEGLRKEVFRMASALEYRLGSNE